MLSRPSQVVLAALFAAIISAVALPADDIGQNGKKWWETAVVYQIYPRSFMDSDGDGVGDLKGITSKLEHLKDIGVGAVWLSPIYPSPQADFGYDISNFTDIDPQYGTLADFEVLKKTANDLGLRVVLDFVPNHSSDEHEWFVKSVKQQEPYTDYYIWSPGKVVDGKRVPPNNWLSVFRGSAWKWHSERGEFYLHQFADKQPDLNYRNPKVVQEMKDAIQFWLDRGVDGIRVDAIPHLFEATSMADEEKSGVTDDPEDHGYLIHTLTTNLPETYDMVTQWRQILDKHSPDTIMMTEAYASMEETIAYYGTPEKPGAHFPFNFLLIKDLDRKSNATDFKRTIDFWMKNMNNFRKPNWVIGNHDNNRVASSTRYGPELSDGLKMISLMLPGTAMTYNGEEIAMEDTFIRWDESLDPQAINKGEKDYYSVSRDPERTPFQWDDTVSAGFSKNKTTWLPVNPNYWRLNLKAQKEAQHSHYHIYKALTEARKKPALQSHNYEVTIEGEVLVLKRYLDGSDTFYVLVNFGSQQTSLPMSKYGNSLKVWTASLNSELHPGEPVSQLVLRPKAGVVLTTGDAPKPSSASQCTTLGAFLTFAMTVVALKG